MKLKAALLFIPIAALSLQADDLWIDHNPYSSVSSMQAGTVLKLSVDEPVLVEYEYEGNGQETATIKLTPDKNITEFLPAASEDRSIAINNRLRIRSHGRVKFNMAVSIQTVEGETLVIRGARQISYENGRARQDFQITGRVSRRDVSTDRTIRSNDVAELQIVMRGSPIPQNRNLPMKQIPGENGQPARPSATLTDQEKQQILLEYLNRILGETRDQ